MTTRTPAPAPGIYPDVPAATYHAWDALSSSTLRKIPRSPAHARHALDNPQPATPATTRGDALHTAVLEPDRFAERYVVAGPCAATIGSGARKGEPCGAPGRERTAAGEWRCGTHMGSRADLALDFRTVLSPDDHAACQGMAAAVRSHPDVAAALAATTEREVSLVFRWPGTDVLCKARIDLPVWTARLALDLKTRYDDVRPHVVNRLYVADGWYLQAGFYASGAAVLGRPVDDFWFVPVEAEKPHGVTVREVDRADMELARTECAQLVEVWRRCHETDTWPAYPTKVDRIGLPSWKADEILERAWSEA
jgi:PDDEXK-like domain of unknown function (DUF3799)